MQKFHQQLPCSPLFHKTPFPTFSTFLCSWFEQIGNFWNLNNFWKFLERKRHFVIFFSLWLNKRRLPYILRWFHTWKKHRNLPSRDTNWCWPSHYWQQMVDRLRAHLWINKKKILVWQGVSSTLSYPENRYNSWSEQLEFNKEINKFVWHEFWVDSASQGWIRSLQTVKKLSEMIEYHFSHEQKFCLGAQDLERGTRKASL